MVIHYFRSRFTRYQALFQRLSKAWKFHSSTNDGSETLRLFRSFAGIFVALSLAWVAKNETDQRQREKVLHQEWPQPILWSSWLTQHGWSPVNPTFLHRSFHFDQIREESSGIWVNREPCLILIQPNSDTQELWSCTPNPPTLKKSTQLTKMGSGYEGVNRLAEWVQSHSASKPKKPLLRIDPREIRY